MNAFQEVRFEHPGYPICKSFILPYNYYGKICNVVEIGFDEVDKYWGEMLNRLRSFLLDTIKSLEEKRKELKDYEKLELVGDLIGIFFRTPLNREVLPSLIPSPFKIYLVARLLGFKNIPEIQEDPLNFTWSFYSKEVVGKYIREIDAIRKLESYEISDLVEKCWLLFPADTRPVFNTAGLIPHLLLTSAVAWSIAVNMGIKGRRNIACLRLAALLHDIGKPFRYRDHVNASMEVARKLLEEILSEEDVEAVIEAIEGHHNPRNEVEKVIFEADRFASAIDRLRRILKTEPFESIRKALEEAADELGYGDFWEKAVGEWNFWCAAYKKCGDRIIVGLSEEFVKKIRELTCNFTILPKTLIAADEGKERRSKTPHNIFVILMDVGNIQGFIYRSWSLKQVAAASLVMDTLVMAYLPLYIQSWVEKEGYWLPYESFIYTAGGNVELIMPLSLCNIIYRLAANLNEKSLEKYGIPVRVAEAQLYENYVKTIQNLSSEIQLKKLSVKSEKYKAIMPPKNMKGVRELCDFCFLSRPEKNIIPTPEGKLNSCHVCYILWEIGSNIHLKSRYKGPLIVGNEEFSPENIFKTSWDIEKEGARGIKASEYIMEIISGHDEREIWEGARRRNIAAIKVDGALMGLLMATCLSISDAYERSARIDLALKKAIEMSVNVVHHGLMSISKECSLMAASSIKMGIIYAGGDDAVILAPSWMSPLLALVIGKTFSEEMGCVRGLSIGIAAASAKANIWSLIDAASELMGKAKGRARKLVNTTCESTICFDIVESGNLSGSTVEERFNSLRDFMLTLQPYAMSEFEKLLCSLLSVEPNYIKIAYKSYIASRVMNQEILREQVPKDILEDILGEVETAQDWLKGVRRVIRDVLQSARSMLIKARDLSSSYRYVFPIAYVYASRQILRTKKESARKYSFISSLIPANVECSSGLADADRLAKIIGGGMI